MDMSTVEEIEAAIEHLSPDEVARLSEWLGSFEAQSWDGQLERDVRAGHLEKVWEKAQREIEGGKARPLDELCNDG